MRASNFLRQRRHIKSVRRNLSCARPVRRGFSLIELLTVIAIIAVLASLLLTALMSAKRRSRTVTCTGNLHQFTLALNMFMDDFAGQRPSVDNLVSSGYLPSPKSLICPEDKTGNWGQLVQMEGSWMIPTNGSPIPSTNNYSYLLYPLNWSDAEWKTLISAGSRAGVAACQLHGLGNQNFPAVENYSGLLLRAQLDASVIRRQFFWTPLASNLSSGSSGTALANVSGLTGNPLDQLEIFFDDPANWQNLQ
jgi:prepilin-type N-terminal cleavage/methylation domain-containing protein